MQVVRNPVGQRAIDLIFKHRYLVTGLLILLNVGGICLARATPAGSGKGQGEVAAEKPYRENEFMLDLMNSQMNPVPEPGSAGLLLAGLAALLLKRSR